MERVLRNSKFFKSGNLFVIYLDELSIYKWTKPWNIKGHFPESWGLRASVSSSPLPLSLPFFFGSRSKFHIITRLEMLATQARWPLIQSVGRKKRTFFLPLFPFPSYTPFLTKKVPLSYMLPLLPLSFLIHISTRKNCNISSNCSKRPHLLNMNKIAKMGGCYGIFTATGVLDVYFQKA